MIELLAPLAAYIFYRLWRGQRRAAASAALYFVLAYAAAAALSQIQLPPPPRFEEAGQAGAAVLAVATIGAAADAVRVLWPESYFLEVASWAYRPAKAGLAYLNLSLFVIALYTALYIAAKYAPLMATVALAFIWRARRGGGMLLMLAFSVTFAAWLIAPLAQGMFFAFSGPPCPSAPAAVAGAGPPGGFWLETSQGPVYINGPGYGVFYTCGLKATRAIWLWMEVEFSYSFDVKTGTSGGLGAAMYVLNASASAPAEAIWCGDGACGAHVGGRQVGPYDFALEDGESMWLMAQGFTYSVAARGENARCRLRVENATPRLIPAPAPQPPVKPYPPPGGYLHYRGWSIRAEAVNATCVIHAVPGPVWRGETFAYTEALEYARAKYGAAPPFDIYRRIAENPNAVLGIALASLAAGISMGALTGMWTAAASSTIISVMSKMLQALGEAARDILTPYVSKILRRILKR